MPVVDVDEFIRSDESSGRLEHDPRFAEGAAFVDGKFVALSEAFVPFGDLGFNQSDAVYDKATVMRGRYFRLDDHLRRFAGSCAGFQLQNPYPDEALLSIFNRLLGLTGLRSAGVYWCVTRGLAKPGLFFDRADPECFENRFYAKVDPYASLATAQQRRSGLNLKISELYIRIPAASVDPRAKNFHWQDMKLSLFEARRHGSDWSVLTDANGYLTEAPGANIFIVKDGELHTPDAGCLEGITLESVIELAAMLGIATRRRPIHARELVAADDAFLTTTAGGVVPVNRVNGVVLGNQDGPGEMAARLHDLYWERMWDGWKGTPADYSQPGE